MSLLPFDEAQWSCQEQLPSMIDNDHSPRDHNSSFLDYSTSTVTNDTSSLNDSLQSIPDLSLKPFSNKVSKQQYDSIESVTEEIKTHNSGSQFKNSLTLVDHFISPATGQSLSLPTSPSLVSLPPLKPFKHHQLQTSNNTCAPPTNGGESRLPSFEATPTDTSPSNRTSPTNGRLLSSEATPTCNLLFNRLKPIPLCLLNTEQAVEAVKRHVESHYIAGNITARAMNNIWERAINKVIGKRSA